MLCVCVYYKYNIRDCTGFDVHWKLNTASERGAWLSKKAHKSLNGEGYYTVEDLLDAAREEYDNMVDFESAEQELAMAA